jgi:hypothetical protein
MQCQKWRLRRTLIRERERERDTEGGGGGRERERETEKGKDKEREREREPYVTLTALRCQYRSGNSRIPYFSIET